MRRDIFYHPRLEQLEDRTVPSTLPIGFTETTFASGLNTPTAMEFAPDGRLFVTEKGGAVRVIQSNGTLQSMPFLTVGVNTASERGFLGITFDPAFSSNGFVYVYYTTNAATPVNRLSRFTVSAVNPSIADPLSETILLDNIASTNGNHNGGSLHFGNDGKLYIGIGEAGVPANSRTLSNLSGKVLRINSDGTIPSDNPFVATANARGEIWANGFRNPFTFNVDPTTGQIYVNDVGATKFEEINKLVKGADYGWAIAEGPSSTAGLTSPIYSYAHDGNGDAITGGVFYRKTQFPASYNGSYFFADYLNNFIRRLDGNTGAAREFITAANSPVDLDVGADGKLYYLSLLQGKVYSIQHVGLTHNLMAASTGAGGGTLVKVIDANTNATLKSFVSYPGYNGSVNVAMAELTGDGVPDVITGAGANAHVKVFDGSTGEGIQSFLAFPGFGGGVFVAGGDINKDGTDDIVVGAAAGAGPHVKVFSGKDLSLLRSFFAYGSGFSGGVRVASADYNNDGTDDIITAPGAGSAPQIRVFSGTNQTVLADFLAYGAGFTGGVFVSAGDLDGDGKAEIVTGTAGGAGPHVKVFAGGSPVLKASFFAYTSSFTGGVRVGVVDTDGDGKKEIITATGPSAAHVKLFNFSPLQETDSYFAFDPGFTGGVFVAGQ